MVMKPFKVGKRRRTIKRRFRFGPAIGRLVGFMTLALLVFVALSQATGRETAIYEATTLREDEGSIQQELNELKLLEARAKTLERITQSEVKDELVPIGDDVEYLDSETTVAGAQIER